MMMELLGPSHNSSLLEDKLREICCFNIETSPSQWPHHNNLNCSKDVRLPPHIHETFDEIDQLHLRWEEENQRSHNAFSGCRNILTASQCFSIPDYRKRRKR
jgi:hypothetical protein